MSAEIIECPNCGYAIRKNWTYCPQCGADPKDKKFQMSDDDPVERLNRIDRDLEGIKGWIASKDNPPPEDPPEDPPSTDDDDEGDDEPKGGKKRVTKKKGKAKSGRGSAFFGRD